MNNSPLTVTLGGIARTVVWNNAALYRADEIGLMELLAAGKFSYSTLCKMIWVMLDDASRKVLPTPESVAAHVSVTNASPLYEVVLKAFAQGNGTKEESPSKNGIGGSEPSHA